MQGIRGKRVLVTGGSSGIGQAIAVRFGLEGAHVAINYRKNVDEAEETQEQIHAAIEECGRQIDAAGARHILVQADVAQEKDICAMFATTIRELGGLDILINNAGIQMAAESHDITAEQYDRVLDVNARGAFLCAREAIRHFLAESKPGVIVNMSSVHQIIPKPRFLSYAMSKGAMQNLTQTLALEYAGRGIRINGVGPGATVTPINQAWIDDPEQRAEVESHIPLGRAGSAEEMAAITVFLCSDEAAYITGQTIFVDGGLTLYPDFRSSWSSE